MQMVKHRKDPKKAIILSKDGKTTARTTMRAMLKMRIATRIIARSLFPITLDWFSMVSGPIPTPQRTSAVATKGRALCRR